MCVFSPALIVVVDPGKRRTRLAHGQKIALLTSRQGRVLLGYAVEHAFLPLPDAIILQPSTTTIHAVERDGLPEHRIRFTLLLEVELSISGTEKRALEQRNLFRLEVSRLKPYVVLKRDDFLGIFDLKRTGINPIKLSRVQCILQWRAGGVYITDTSTNGIQIDGQEIGKS